MKTIKSLGVCLLILAALPLSRAYAQNPLTNGLVAFYPFLGNATDVTGDGNDGTVQGVTLTTNQFGAQNSAYYFNGAASSIVLPPAAFTGMAQGTIAMWACLQDNTHGTFFAEEVDGFNTYGVFSVGSYCADGGAPSVGTPGTLYFHPFNGAGVLASSAASLPTGTWCQVALAFSDTGCSFYINGVLAGSASGDFSIRSAGGPETTIGAWESLNQTTYYDVVNGDINNCFIYNRALSAPEMLELFEYGVGGVGANILITSAPASVTTNQNASVNFSVAAYSTLPLTYQWQFDGLNLPGATNNTLQVTNVQFDVTGTYDVVVANSSDSVTSAGAFLSLAIPNAPTAEVNSNLVTVADSVVGSATVSLNAGFPDGLILFSLTGDNEDGDFQIYTGPFTVTNSVYITAVGYSSDFSESAEMQPLALDIIPVYGLTTSTVGNGAISLYPDSSPFPSNTVVMLTASAAPNWAFDHWQGSVTNYGNPLILPVNTNLDLQAVFIPAPFALTLTTAGGGTVQGVGQSADGINFASNSVVTLTASNYSGWVFLDWQGGLNSTANPCAFAITQSLNIQGLFGTPVITNAVGGGEILLNTTNLIPYGGNVTASAVAGNGNYFVAWSGAARGTNSPVDATITNGNAPLNALFIPLPAHKFSLSTAVLGNGSVGISPRQSYYDPGAVVTLTAVPNAPSVTFYGWQGADHDTNSVTTITLATNLIVYANFSGLPPPSPAAATADIDGGLCVSATVTSGGSGYTNIPVVTFLGGGGSGAAATAIVQNGVVVGVNIVNGGNGYTNAPQIIIQPPVILTPQINIARASCLTFSNLTISDVYLLQRYVDPAWENSTNGITATNTLTTVWVDGAAAADSYRLVATPLPTPASAIAITSYGFVVSATVTNQGSGYTSAPLVTIMGGGGAGASAFATVSNGVVASLTIVSPGGGYTSTPAIAIAAPPLTGGFPGIQPGVLLGMGNLMTNQIYQLQFAGQANGPWAAGGVGDFLTVGTNLSEYLLITNATSYFQLQYVP